MMLVESPATMQKINREVLDPLLTLGSGSPLAGGRVRGMDSPQARIMLLAIGGQESNFADRFQVIEPTRKKKGPARGFWQHELGGSISGTDGKTSWGIYHHPASRDLLRRLCTWMSVDFEPRAIWEALEHNDLFAAGVARLLLWTDPRPIPKPGDLIPSWRYYLDIWRPGKPHERRWAGNYFGAYEAVAPAAARKDGRPCQ